MTSQNRRDIPHPVLTPGGFDYVPQAEFKATVEKVRKTSQDQRIYIPVHFQLTEDDLLRRVAEGEAAYVVLTDCVASRTRERHQTSEERIVISLDAKEYYSEIRIQPFITSTRRVDTFTSKNWTSWVKDVLPHGVDLPAGAILAMAAEKTIPIGEPDEIQSCVQIVPTDRVVEGQFNVDLSSDHIHILVNPADKPKIDRMRANEDEQDKLWPSMYQTAIEKAVRYHTVEDNSEKTWAKTVARTTQEHEIDTSNLEDLQENSLIYAQQIMGNPLQRIMDQSDELPEEWHD